MDPAAKILYRSEPLRKPLLQEAIHAQQLPLGSRGLDVGCGIGLQAILLAEAVGAGGRVTGLDAAASLLELAGQFTHQAGLAGRIDFRQGDWSELPFEDEVFDWVWSADAAGYAAPDPVQQVCELARVVKPGGSLLLLFWSGQALLPGNPALEARLNASRAGTAPFAPEARPETHFLRALGWLRAAGLVEPRAETYVRSVTAPLGQDMRDALADLFEMRWGGAQADVSEEDWREYLRLCKPGSEGFILNDPGYYAFFTYSLFAGRARYQRR